MSNAAGPMKANSISNILASEPLTRMEPVCKSPWTKHSFFSKKILSILSAVCKTCWSPYTLSNLSLTESEQWLVSSSLLNGLWKTNSLVSECMLAFLKTKASIIFQLNQWTKASNCYSCPIPLPLLGNFENIIVKFTALLLKLEVVIRLNYNG